jgi:tetratricopeptide (TPR) repeat protein
MKLYTTPKICLVVLGSLAMSVVLSAEEAEVPQLVIDCQRVVEEIQKTGNLVAIEAEYLKIIAAFPASEHALNAQTAIALTYIRAGDTQQASAAMAKLSEYKSQEDYVECAKQVQDAYWWAGKFQESNAVCRQLLAEFPAHPRAISLQKDLTNAYISMGDTAQASQQLEIFWSTYKDREDFVQYAKQLQDAYWQAGKFQESNAVCRRLLAEFPTHPMAILLRRDLVFAYIQLGNTVDAEAAMKELMATYSGDAGEVSAVADACWFYRQQGDYSKALEIYQRLLKDHPDSERALDIEGEVIAVYLEQGAKAMADARLATLRSAYAGHPSLPPVLNELGNDYRTHGYYTDCIRLHESSVALNPDAKERLNAYAGMAKAQVWLPAAMSDPNEVEGVALQILQPEAVVDQLVIDYANVSGLGFHVFQIGEEYYFLGEKLVKQGKREQGHDAFEKAIRVWSKNKTIPDRHHAAMAAYYSGVASGYLGDDVAALAYYQEVAQAYPEYEKAWHARFMVAECAGKLAAAGKVNQANAAAVQLTAYQDLLLNDPNCPVSSIVRQKVQTIAQ